MKQPHVCSCTERNRFGAVVLERLEPFRSAFTDCGMAVLRCNNDYRFMGKGFPDSSTLEDSFRPEPEDLAAAFRAMRPTICDSAAMRRMAQSAVAAHVVARLVDFCITKYAAKPM